MHRSGRLYHRHPCKRRGLQPTLQAWLQNYTKTWHHEPLWYLSVWPSTTTYVSQPWMFATKSLHWSFQFKSIAIQFSMVSNIEVHQLQFTTKHIRHLLQRYITLFVVTTDAKLTLGDLPSVPFPDDLFLAFFNCFSCVFTLPHHWLQLPSNTQPSSSCKISLKMKT
jgi:hypothetical protein